MRMTLHISKVESVCQRSNVSSNPFTQNKLSSARRASSSAAAGGSTALYPCIHPLKIRSYWVASSRSDADWLPCNITLTDINV